MRRPYTCEACQRRNCSNRCQCECHRSDELTFLRSRVVELEREGDEQRDLYEVEVHKLNRQVDELAEALGEERTAKRRIVVNHNRYSEQLVRERDKAERALAECSALCRDVEAERDSLDELARERLDACLLAEANSAALQARLDALLDELGRLPPPNVRVAEDGYEECTVCGEQVMEEFAGKGVPPRLICTPGCKGRERP